jgi:hypothetical protein
MGNRVKVLTGSNPILIVAPHGGGPTDLRSALIADIIAKETKAYAVINKGWERKPIPNFRLNQANCNDLDHCHQEPLFSEFLTPIDDFRAEITANHFRVYMFLIHGMDDQMRNYNGVDVVIGYGAGTPSRHSCNICFKNRFISCLDLEAFTPAQGMSGGRLSAWDVSNLNQLYTTDPKVESVQVEIGLSLRKNNSIARKTAERLSEAIIRACDNSRFVPSINNIKEI